MTTRFETVDAYIEAQPTQARAMLNELRAAVRAAAPAAEESIRYDIPSYKLDGRPMISFGAWKHHVGLYPVHTLDESLEREVGPLRAAKSTLQLPLGKPYPGDLMKRVMKAIVDRTTRIAEASM